MKTSITTHIRLAGLCACLSLLVACSESPTEAPIEATAEATAEEVPEAAPAATATESPKTSHQGSSYGRALDGAPDLSKLPRYAGTSQEYPPKNTAEGPVLPTPGVPAPTEPTGPTPEIRFAEGQEDTRDFGEVLQGYKAETTFSLIAQGEADLVISRLKPSCGCTVADIKLINADGTRTVYTIGDPIPAGTAFDVETSIVTDGRQGPMSTYVTVYSNEARGFMNLHLKAEVSPVLIVEPTTLNFGPVTSSDALEGSVKVMSTVLDPFLLTVDEQFIVAPMAVELVPTDPNAEGRASEWTLKVTLGPSIPEGMRNYPIILKTDALVPNPKEHDHQEGEAAHAEPTYEGRLFVQAQVTGLVSANPSFLSYGMVRPGQVMERVVKIQCHDDFELSEGMPLVMTGLRGEEFPYADNFTLSLTKLSDGSVDLLLRLEGLPDDLTGSFGGVVDIGVGHPTKDKLQVRFSGICKPGLKLPAQPQPNENGQGH